MSDAPNPTPIGPNGGSIDSLVAQALGTPVVAGNRSDWSFLSEASLASVRSRAGRQRFVLIAGCLLTAVALASVIWGAFRPGAVLESAYGVAAAEAPGSLAVPQVDEALPTLVGQVAGPLALWALGFGLLWFAISRFRRRRVSRPLGRIARSMLVVVAALIVLVGAFVTAVDVYFIPSGSMHPTLQAGDRIFVDGGDTDVAVGDVIVHDSYTDAARIYGGLASVKRVVGIGGDVVEGSGGQLLVNGEPSLWLSDSSPLPLGDFDAVQVDPGHVFVLGDNHSGSTDSRFEGPMSTDLIRGTVRAVWTPGGRS